MSYKLSFFEKISPESFVYTYKNTYETMLKQLTSLGNELIFLLENSQPQKLKVCTNELSILHLPFNF